MESKPGKGIQNTGNLENSVDEAKRFSAPKKNMASCLTIQSRMRKKREGQRDSAGSFAWGHWFPTNPPNIDSPYSSSYYMGQRVCWPPNLGVRSKAH